MLDVSMHVVGGYPERMPLRPVARFLNRAFAGEARFRVSYSVETLGDPDLDGEFYSCDMFADTMDGAPDQGDVVLVFTEVPIEDNFFAKTVLNMSIITTYQADEALRDSEFTLYDYLVLKSIQEAFWIACKIHCDDLDRQPLASRGGLFHFDRLGCLFNYSIHKLEEQVHKLRASAICPVCAARAVDEFDVPQSLVHATQRSLRLLTRPTPGRSFRRMMGAPGLNFAYGVLIGGLLTNIIAARMSEVQASGTPVPWSLIALLVAGIAVPATVYVGHLVRHRRQVAAMTE